MFILGSGGRLLLLLLLLLGLNLVFFLLKTRTIFVRVVGLVGIAFRLFKVVDLLRLIVSGLFSKHIDQLVRVGQFFPLNPVELQSQVKQVVGQDHGATILLAQAKDVTTANELFIKHNDDTILRAANNRTSSTERNVFALLRIQVNYTMTHLKAVSVLFPGRGAPEGEPLSKDLERANCFFFTNVQTNIIELFLNHFGVVV